MRLTRVLVGVALAAGAGIGLLACKSPPATRAPGEAEDGLAGITFVKPSKDYPLKTCVVSGEPLDNMGEPVAIVYEGTEVQFCCAGCVDDFQKDPAKYLGMVRAAKK